MTEKELIAKLIQKDEEAFRRLVDNYQVKVRNTCMGMVHNKFEADDLAQEVFIEVYESIEKFRGDSSLSTWIYRISMNKSLNHIRSKKRKQWLSYFSSGSQIEKTEKELSDEQEPQKLMEDNETVRLLNSAIDSLPDNQKAAFVLSKYEGLANTKIAEIMKTSVSSVESLNFRAKKNLQKKLNGLQKK